MRVSLPHLSIYHYLWQEFVLRTSGLSVSEDQHYVYPGVRGPLLLPSDYIRKYFCNLEVSYLFLNLMRLLYFWLLFLLQLWRRCCLISGTLFCGRVGTFWVGASGIMFRIFLGGWLCRLQFLWGEFRFLFLFGSWSSVRGSGCFNIAAFAVVDYLMKRFGSARYLLLKIGTNCKVFGSIGFFCCRWFMIWSGAVVLRFLLISAIFIVYGLFSVLKVLFGIHFVLSKEVMFCAYAGLFK